MKPALQVRDTCVFGVYCPFKASECGIVYFLVYLYLLRYCSKVPERTDASPELSARDPPEGGVTARTRHATATQPRVRQTFRPF